MPKRSANRILEERGTRYPPYREHPTPLEYPLKTFTPLDLIGFRVHRWSEPGFGITQEVLGGLLGLSARAIQRYESGDSPITQVLVMALCDLDRRLCDWRRAADQDIAPVRADPQLV